MDATPSTPLQTFVMADLAGYTALTEAHGDEAAADAAAAFFDAARALLPDFGAEEVKTIGDAILIRAPDAAAGVRLAERLVCDYGAQHRGLGIRAGVHSGTAVERDGDWFGTAVNLTARIADAAAGGEVLVSGPALHGAGDALREIDPSPRGAQAFKNFPDPVEIFELDFPDAPAVLPVDPVCRMAVEPERAAAREFHEGREYYFCSQECHSRFVASPSSFVDTP